ncbi:hypothetical protein CEXT_759351 [Caerostris extrusa]|uniref:Uncharacterized protein n=1 Tax=Caerostris extrusa TaxID=172846 RepID=A0AAV4NTS5_CAEEX|nr:hypothetical protein CEXT_759351 [Caerostris extrusa]
MGNVVSLRMCRSENHIRNFITIAGEIPNMVTPEPQIKSSAMDSCSKNFLKVKVNFVIQSNYYIVLTCVFETCTIKSQAEQLAIFERKDLRCIFGGVNENGLRIQ